MKWISFLLLSVWSTIAIAQLNIQVQSPSSVIVGDVFTIRVEAKAIPKGAQIQGAESTLHPKLQIIRVEDSLANSTFIRSYECIAIETDNIQFNIPIRYSEKGELNFFNTDSIFISATLLLIDTSQAFAPEKDILNVTLEWYELLWFEYTYWIIGFGIGLLGLLIFAAIYFLIKTKEKKSKPIEAESVKEESPVIKIQATLLYLQESGNTINQKEWFSLLTDSLRVYLGKCYGFQGLELTSNQFFLQIRKKFELSSELENLRQVLIHGDYAKFANAEIPLDQLEADIICIERIVHLTQHRFQTEEGGAK